MQIVHDSPRALAATIAYPKGYRFGNPLYEYDIDYLKSRILTYRSAHTTQIDTVTSQYYEGAKTLVELLDIMHRTGAIQEISPLNLSIMNEPDQFPMSTIIFCMTTPLLRKDSLSSEFTHQAQASITLLYTRETDREQGMFVIYGEEVIIDEMGNISNFEGSRCFTVGDTPVSDMYDGEIPEELAWLKSGVCFKAGAILKYSENFPTYSKLAADIVNGLYNISRDITENSVIESETTTEV